MSRAFFNAAKFILSAPNIKNLPVDEGYEIAFLGRSNSGKSSAINALVDNKSLARTSKTPGRTAALNIFAFDDERKLVDVPGFGYAKVTLSTKEKWRNLINEYLFYRKSLQGVVLLMDIRHPFMPQDVHLIEWLKSCKLQTHVLLTKADKLGHGARKNVLLKVQQQLGEQFIVSLFSAKSRIGIDELRSVLLSWYKIDDAKR